MLNSISVKSISIRPNSAKAKFPRDKARLAGHLRACAVIASIVLAAALAPAFGQTLPDFTVTASAPSPFAVEPSGTASSNLTVNPVNTTSAVDVALSCTVTPVQTAGTPVCTVSPQSVTAPATPSLTITTTGATAATVYAITVTGVGNNNPSDTQTAIVNLSVLAVTADYTLTVTTPVTPGSVHAGSGATAVITVTSLNGYSGAVTLSCSAITPAVAFGPTCSFPSAVTVASNGTQTGTLTVNTRGTTTTPPTTSLSHRRIFYALFLPLPGIALAAAGCGRKKLLALLAPCALALALLLPACSSSNNSNTTTTATGVTPNNTYTITITGTDTNALAPSNGTQSVTLTVN
jgi:uncharacterized protein